MELESQVEAFRKRGLGVAALSYDTVDILKDFATRRSITFPLLSDADSRIIRAYGLINEIDYPPGSPFHGVPFPGTFVADAQGRIRSKDFEEAYQERRTAASLLVAEGESPGASVTEIKKPQFTLRTSVSSDQAATGRILTLVLEFSLGPNMHMYAPGVTGYRPLKLTLDPHPLIRPGVPVFPASRPYTFEPLKETVPVFESAFRVVQDITVLAPPRPAPGESPAPPPAEIVVTGSVESQVCSDKLCYAPSTLPVRWTLKYVPLDRERVPEAMRKLPLR